MAYALPLHLPGFQWSFAYLCLFPNINFTLSYFPQDWGATVACARENFLSAQNSSGSLGICELKLLFYHIWASTHCCWCFLNRWQYVKTSSKSMHMSAGAKNSCGRDPLEENEAQKRGREEARAWEQMPGPRTGTGWVPWHLVQRLPSEALGTAAREEQESGGLGTIILFIHYLSQPHSGADEMLMLTLKDI